MLFGLGVAISVIPDVLLYQSSNPWVSVLQIANTVVDVGIFLTAFVLLKIEIRRNRVTYEQLAVLNRHQAEFLQIAAHDLRNPLNAIIQIAALLPSQERESAAAIRVTAGEMVETIDAMLDMAALERGQIKLRLTEADLTEVARKVVERNQPYADRKQIALRLEAPEPCWAAFDPGRIRQAIDNLVSNAIKFSPPGREVHIAVCRKENRLRVEVADEGLGFSEEDRKKLFKRFARLSARPTAGESSTGLGLANARHLVELHGGTIQAESAGPGQGSCFWIDLPGGDLEMG